MKVWVKVENVMQIKGSIKLTDLFLMLGGFFLVAVNVVFGENAIFLKTLVITVVFFLNIYFALRFFRFYRIRFLTIFIGFLTLSLLYLQIRYFILFRNPAVSHRLGKSLYVALFQFSVLVLLAIPVVVHSLSTVLNTIYDRIGKRSSSIFFFSMLLWSGMVFIHSPLTVFTSSWGEFNISVFQLLPWLFLYFTCFLVGGYIFFRFIPRELKIVLVWIMFLLAITFWLYTYIIPGDFGHLDNFELSETNSLYNRGGVLLFLEIFGLFAGSIVLLILLNKAPGQIFAALVILNLMTYGQTGANIITSGVIKSKLNISKNSVKEKIPEYSSSLLNFSQEANVIIFMLDMFCGGFVPEIMEKNPEIKENFDGFTWYANALSTTTATYGSIPAIVGGDEYTIGKYQKTDNYTISELYKDAYGFFPEFFMNQGFVVSYTDPFLINLSDLESNDEILIGKSKDFIPYWNDIQDSNFSNNIRVSILEYSRIFAAIGLFKGSPYIFKSRIYLGGSWLKTKGDAGSIRHAMENLALLESAPLLSRVDSPQKTFKYISNELPHTPWAINEMGDISRKIIHEEPLDIYSSEFDKMFRNPVLPYYAATKTLSVLGKWFKWMKTVGIYDNTRIVIVSDHGYTGLDPMFEEYKVINDERGKIREGAGRFHPLFMVKDFNQKEPFSRSDHFVSNSDTAAFATMGIALVDPLSDPLSLESDGREIITSILRSGRQNHEAQQYDLVGQFLVKDNIFKEENWIDLMDGRE